MNSKDKILRGLPVLVVVVAPSAVYSLASWPTHSQPASIVTVPGSQSRVTHHIQRCSSARPMNIACRNSYLASRVRSSFYGDFENFDDDDDDEDSGETDREDSASLDDFRKKMDFLIDDDATSSSSDVDELIDFVRGSVKNDNGKQHYWAEITPEIGDGVVLLANPAKFCTDFGSVSISSDLLSKFGFTMPLPAEIGPDRRADMLPVLLLVETSRNDKRVRGVLLNRRTGYLLGDLAKDESSSDKNEDYLLEKFCIQPLWFGGIANINAGLNMLHQCPALVGCKELPNCSGLYWGGDPGLAHTAIEETNERALSGFDFKFFVQSTVWSLDEIKMQIEDEAWYLAKVSKEVLFKPRDRTGSQRAKPLWTECMELLGDRHINIRDALYEK